MDEMERRDGRDGRRWMDEMAPLHKRYSPIPTRVKLVPVQQRAHVVNPHFVALLGERHAVASLK